MTGVLYYIAACDDFVGRAPWPAADPLVGLLRRRKSRTRASAPRFWLRLCCSVGRRPSKSPLTSAEIGITVKCMTLYPPNVGISRLP
jgi:hypothetical protein